MKHCYTCNTHKDESEFYRNDTKWDGLSSQCKSCISDYHYERRARQYQPYNVPHLTPDWRMGWLFGKPESVEVEHGRKS